MNDIPRIRPEIVAAKFAALRNFEQPTILDQVEKEPRLLELLWFIQWHSFQPGGLKKFTENFLNQFPQRIGTEAMIRFGEPKNGTYKIEQCIAVWKNFPSYIQDEFWPKDYTDFYSENAIDKDDAPALVARESLSKANYRRFKSICRDGALEKLPRYFASLCNDVSRGFDPSLERWNGEWTDKGETWCFHNIIDALLEAMANQSKQVSARLAQTAVTVKVFDALNYAWEENALVHIEGDSRFGKTESVRAWANMHPGRARLVAVPCTNSDSDLYKEVAEALGMEVNMSRTKLKDRVEFVLQNGRLGIIFDEAAFLIQQRYSSNTPPMRLNWIRTQIVDKNLPLALCATPQTYVHAMARFVKKTGHNIQQFLGRKMLSVMLPNELDEEDLIAVAKIHFPELDEDYLALIAAKAMQSESYLMAVEAIAKRTRFISRRDGHSQITMADLELAISEVLPPVQRNETESAQPLQRPGKRIAMPLQKPNRTEQLRQEFRPLLSDTEETISSSDRNRLSNSPLKVPA